MEVEETKSKMGGVMARIQVRFFFSFSFASRYLSYHYPSLALKTNLHISFKYPLSEVKKGSNFR